VRSLSMRPARSIALPVEAGGQQRAIADSGKSIDARESALRK
jgi:hypothetical protein